MDRSSNLARNILVAVLVAALLLFYIYPATTLYISTDQFPFTIFLQHPDELTPPITAPKLVTYLEHVPRPNIPVNDCDTLSDGAKSYCEVSHCISFFGLFEFWFPGCQKLVDDFTPYTVNDWDEIQALSYPGTVMERVDTYGNNCSTLTNNGAIAYCEVSRCIDFFEFFRFWYPGCQDLTYAFTPYSLNNSDDQASLLAGTPSSVSDSDDQEPVLESHPQTVLRQVRRVQTFQTE